jgi:hypothetical protein
VAGYNFLLNNFFYKQTNLFKMKQYIQQFCAALFIMLSLASCSSTNMSMREPNSRVNFTKSDFTFSEQLSAEATTNRILGIDWWRLFSKKTGKIDKDEATTVNLATIPVIGSLITDPTANYALYNLMSANAGYDVVFYPQYATVTKKPVIGIGFFYKKTTVTVKARLGKIN